jgi:hypothetical protein
MDGDTQSDNKDTAVTRTSYTKKFSLMFKHYETAKGNQIKMIQTAKEVLF